jgi:glycerol-3-phosphate dehydrogenase (NAD+)
MPLIASNKGKEKACIIGSGNWGSAIAKIVGLNLLQHRDIFHQECRMWVYEELVDGQKLTDIINHKHENVKYLPGIKLPENIVACSDLVEAARDATILIFVLPHQFVKKTCEQLKAHLTEGTKAISLIKGIDINVEKEALVLVSDIIKHELNVDVSVLMGANIASEVAREQFCETTIGYRTRENGELMKLLFERKHFRVSIVQDVEGVELCGALKNIVGVAAGLVDGLKLGDNTKAAIIRIGLMEIMDFVHLFYPHEKKNYLTFLQSCGVADLVTTCYGGRNRKVAEAHAITGKSFEQLEQELLNGQKLQGTLTAKEVHLLLKSRRVEKNFPLFKAVYEIVWEGKEAKWIIDGL